MKRGSFKKKTYEEIVEIQKSKKHPPKRHKIDSKGVKVAKSTRLHKVAGITKKIPLNSSKLKKELDRVFSLYVRKFYPKVCYTCGKPAERLQCGHYISRQFLATRWSMENCRPQCWGCNGYGKGQPLVFEEKLKAEYGNDFVEAMKASRHQIIKLDRQWYQTEIEKYKSMLE